ncbi:hypothetical protein CLOM621_05786 [Clostridium sp. M62/1]|nr:hypothetical protein CLOM621_05786 [Clostridium sp. M62/1]
MFLHKFTFLLQSAVLLCQAVLQQAEIFLRPKQLGQTVPDRPVSRLPVSPAAISDA